jgi:hypothetical protein
MTQQEQAFLNTSLEESSKLVGYLATMTDILNANKVNKNRFSHTVCKDPVLTNNIVIQFPKQFYLAETINRKISSFLASGIMSYWINTYVEKEYWDVKGANTGPQQLTIEHLLGSFYLWMICCSISLLNFMIEIFIGKIQNSTKQKWKRKILNLCSARLDQEIV